MLERAWLYLFDKVLSYAVRKNDTDLFNGMFERFPKTGELYKKNEEEAEASLERFPDITEKDSHELWNRICDEIENIS